MPGPCSKPNPTYQRDEAAPNKKAAGRLARREADYHSRNSQNGQEMHFPGSQNRNK